MSCYVCSSPLRSLVLGLEHGVAQKLLSRKDDIKEERKGKNSSSVPTLKNMNWHFYKILHWCVSLSVRSGLLHRNTADKVICNEQNFIWLPYPRSRCWHPVGDFLEAKGRKGKERRGQIHPVVLALIPSTKMKSSLPNYFLKAPPLNTVIMAIKFSMHFEGENHWNHGNK